LNIRGLSEATIEKLIAKGLVKELADIFHLEKHKDIITKMEGFGEKSFNNLVSSVNKARKTTAARLLFSFGIANIGLSNAKLISRKFGDDWEKIQKAKYEDLIQISGIGDVMANNYVKFFSDEKNKAIVEDVLKEVEIEASSKTASEQIFENCVFVITGSVEHFKNRDELKAVIEERGGKVASSVTSKTTYLINNDVSSSSTKNKKAKELGIEIITEEQFLQMLNKGNN